MIETLKAYRKFVEDSKWCQMPDGKMYLCASHESFMELYNATTGADTAKPEEQKKGAKK